MQSKFVLALFVFLSFFTYVQAQIIDNPECDKSDNSNVVIRRIEITDYTTIVTFFYQASDEYVKGGWFNMNPEVCLKSSDGKKVYKLIHAEGIPLAPNKKDFDYAGQIVSYRLTFPKLDSCIEKIDIIECSTSNCFNFYGVSLSRKNNNNNHSQSENTQFRRDYDYVCWYKPKTQSWSDWQKGPNTFVFNINDNGDFKLFDAQGKTEIYRKVSPVKNECTDKGEKYQTIQCLKENGEVCSFNFSILEMRNLFFQMGKCCNLRILQMVNKCLAENLFFCFL